MIIPPRATRQGGSVPAITIDDELSLQVTQHIWSWTGRYFFSNIGEEFVNAKGYKARRLVSLHNFIWLLAGNPVAAEVDHINRDATDNRLCNLRASDRKLNGSNRAFKKKEGGLPQGVSQCKKKFRVRMKIGKKNFHIGTYSSVSEAANSYQEMQSLVIRYRDQKIKETT